MTELMKSVDAYIEFAEATKRFADLAFYNRVKLALAKADHADELANSAANLCNFLMQVGVHPLAIPRVDDLLSEITSYREATE